MSRSDTTKDAIATAFREVLAANPVEKVTVAAIARQAGINRQTFYYHFRDIYDLVSWISRRNISQRMGGALTRDNWREGLLSTLVELRENHDLVVHALHGSESTFAHRFAQEEVSKLVSSLVARETRDLHASDEDLSLVTEFYVAGLLETLRAWVANGMYEDPARLADRLALLMENALVMSLHDLSEA